MLSPPDLCFCCCLCHKCSSYLRPFLDSSFKFPKSGLALSPAWLGPYTSLCSPSFTVALAIFHCHFLQMFPSPHKTAWQDIDVIRNSPLLLQGAWSEVGALQCLLNE